MYKKITLLVLLVSGLCLSARAQKTFIDDEQSWFAVFNQVRLTEKWGIWHDSHIRFKDNFVGAPAQFLFRIGPTFYVNNDVRLTAGYNFINHFPETGHAQISMPEHRPFQQVQWFTRFSRARVIQMVRIEERFRRRIANDSTLADGYNYNGRVRYNLAYFLPLTRRAFDAKGLQLMVNNEVMVNFGKNIVYNYFDQNRFFVGFNYPFSAHSQLQFGYMNLFQQLPAGNRYRNIHAARVFYLHNFDWRKK